MQFSWDNAYSREISNFEKNPEDTGESWFSDSNAQDTIYRLLRRLVEEEEHKEHPLITDQSSFLDLGTGNGELLFNLRDQDFEGHLTGIDYSQQSVDLARKIAVKNYHWDPEDESYEFLHADFLSSEDWLKQLRPSVPPYWDVILDKGTLDAIALSDLKYNYEGSEISGVDLYPLRVARLVGDKSGDKIKPGLLVITSCNFTQEELIVIMEKSGKFKYYTNIEYPKFKFGGAVGQTICTVAFQSIP